ncbi:MAG TPA: hypothetical protein PKO18_00550 [Chitinophagales bacterium]|nr:hypothetical protein [Chitinophagales bacterium]
MRNTENKRLQCIRRWTVFFMIGLALSGITAFPIETEINIYDRFFSNNHFIQEHFSTISGFLNQVSIAVHDTAKNYPFIFYGTDWLAFAHLLLAILFYGVYKDPVRNIWIVEFGMIACISVIPLAFICGPIRGIPLYWRIIDSSFGQFGIIPLWIMRRQILYMQRI